MLNSDPEISLTRGPFRLTVSPYGASLRGLSRMGADVVTGYSGADHKVGGQGDVLIPFPGRVAGGHYEFEGSPHQLERSDREGPNAIHGFVRHVLWETVEQTEHSVTFRTEFDAAAHLGYPFALSCDVTYTVTETGMACAFAVVNTGTGPAPVGAGFHPYFAVGGSLIDVDTLLVPFASILEFENLVPTGQVLAVSGTEYDYRAPRPVGATVFNTCYLNPERDEDGWARIQLSSPATGRSVSVELDATFGYVVLYSGDPLPESHRRRSLAIEPMTCGSDAFNYPEWGLAMLTPSETLSGEWRVTEG